MNDKIPTKARTIDEVLDQLDDIINQSIVNDDYIFLFTFVYRETTAEVKKAIQEDRFENPTRMEKMDVIFANLFINAFYEYQNSRSPSLSWNFAFDARKDRLAFVQHILLGMNAHINLDLSIAAANVSEGQKIIDIKNDFMTINKILAELTNRMQVRLGRISFLMKVLDIFGFRSDEKIINFSIKKARDFAWLNALELALQPNDQREIRQKEIDRRVLEISRMVKNPPGRLLSITLKIISLFEPKNPSIIMKKLQ